MFTQGLSSTLSVMSQLAEQEAYLMPSRKFDNTDPVKIAFGFFVFITAALTLGLIANHCAEPATPVPTVEPEVKRRRHKREPLAQAPLSIPDRYTFVTERQSAYPTTLKVGKAPKGSAPPNPEPARKARHR